MFEYPRMGRQARNFTTNVPKILDVKSSSGQIFSENWCWVPLNELKAVCRSLTRQKLFSYTYLHAFDHICMEKARYKFLIIIIIVIIIVIIIWVT